MNAITKFAVFRTKQLATKLTPLEKKESYRRKTANRAKSLLRNPYIEKYKPIDPQTEAKITERLQKLTENYGGDMKALRKKLLTGDNCAHA